MLALPALLIGCAAREPSIVGRWQADGETLQFSNDRTFKGTFAHKLPSGAALDKNPEPGDQIIDIGRQLIASYGSYPNEASTTARIEGADKLLQISYDPVQKEKAVAWSSILVRTESSGQLAVFKEIGGRAISGYAMTKPQILKLAAGTDGGPSQIEWASLRIDWIDLDLNWSGVLSISGQYRYDSRTRAFELYASLAPGRNVRIAEARVEPGGLRLLGLSFGMRSLTYKKHPEAGVPEASTAPEAGAIFDASGVGSVRCFGNVYVNSGLIIHRVQNVVFRLPRPESLASIKLTEPPRSEVPPLMVRAGAH